jgi:hypothetical protein
MSPGTCVGVYKVYTFHSEPYVYARKNTHPFPCPDSPEKTFSRVTYTYENFYVHLVHRRSFPLCRRL